MDRNNWGAAAPTFGRRFCDVAETLGLPAPSAGDLEFQRGRDLFSAGAPCPPADAVDAFAGWWAALGEGRDL